MLNNNYRNMSDIELSKLLSWLLRHGAIKEKLPISNDGFINVETLLSYYKLRDKNVTLADIKRIVASNDKSRFTLVKCNISGELKIKANQGHSIQQVDSLCLQEITDISKYPFIVHGTYYKFWLKIKTEGLKCMRRNHIHFCSQDKIDFKNPNTKKVSGFRENAQILIYVDIRKAIKNGIKFYLSENNVILSFGIDGVLSVDYFIKVIDLQTNKQIL